MSDRDGVAARLKPGATRFGSDGSSRLAAAALLLTLSACSATPARIRDTTEARNEQDSPELGGTEGASSPGPEAHVLRTEPWGVHDLPAGPGRLARFDGPPWAADANTITPTSDGRAFVLEGRRTPGAPHEDVWIVEADTGRELLRLPITGSIRIGRGGRYLLVMHEGRATPVDVGHARLLPSRETVRPFWRSEISQDGTLLWVDADERVHAWDLNTGRDVRSSLRVSLEAGGRGPWPFERGRVLVEDGAARVYDLASGELIHQFPELSSPVERIACSDDRERIAIVSRRGGIFAYRSADLSPAGRAAVDASHSVGGPHGGMARSLVFERDAIWVVREDRVEHQLLWREGVPYDQDLHPNDGGIGRAVEWRGVSAVALRAGVLIGVSTSGSPTVLRARTDSRANRLSTLPDPDLRLSGTLLAVDASGVWTLRAAVEGYELMHGSLHSESVDRVEHVAANSPAGWWAPWWRSALASSDDLPATVRRLYTEQGGVRRCAPADDGRRLCADPTGARRVSLRSAEHEHIRSIGAEEGALLDPIPDTSLVVESSMHTLRVLDMASGDTLWRHESTGVFPQLFPLTPTVAILSVHTRQYHGQLVRLRDGEVIDGFGPVGEYRYAASPDGARFAAAGPEHVQVFALSEQGVQPLTTVTIPGATSMMFSRDGTILAVTDRRGIIEVHRL